MGEYALYAGEEVKIGTCEHVSDEFGNWLAGFIDGEGCFSIFRDANRRSYRCRFDITLHADDEPILAEIARCTGIGKLSWRKGTSEYSPACTWAVQSKEGCLTLVALLDEFPMRARKRADYLIWRQAVQTWTTVSRGQRSGQDAAQAEMARLKLQLTEAKRHG